MPPTSIVPIAMDTVPISGLDELVSHLDKLVADPETPIEAKLFDDVELQLTEANIPPLLPVLLPKLTEILKTTPHDPKTTVALTIKLLSPVSFTQTLSLADESALITALTSPSPPANILAMTILHKAAASASDAAILASMPRVLEEFLRKWLSAPEVEVAEKGNRVLGDLLETDCEVAPLQSVKHAVTVDGVAWTNGTTNAANGDATLARHLRPTGQGHLWRRITRDPSLYSLLISLPRGRDPGTGVSLGDHQTSLTQGRLLRIVPRLAALNFAITARPLAAEAEGDRAAGGVSPSLLRFVALDMVDKKDTLMHLSLIDFFEALLSLLRIRVDEGGADQGVIVDVMRGVIAEATADDNVLKASMLSLPDRTVPEEAESLRAFINQVVT